MPFAIGTRLGPYEITGTLGAGGMGEVYRARDPKLERDVALKILPDAFAADPERLARFRREAQVLASLNHPHIGAIYGFEDSGDVHALVLELVEGDTLVDRIVRGPLPVDEALPIARQIAEALEAAHEPGIIHRDLKPANIKVTPDGVVKVLDFGLAKLTGPAESGPHGRSDLSQSPTITSPAMMTGIGTLLGTAAYMSPEQAKGRPADKRSDVWAFGCVLYEMLTGRSAFEGEDLADTLANVLKGQPDWKLLPGGVPVAIVTLLRRCLEKERGRRPADISAASFVLEHADQLVHRADGPTTLQEPRRRVWRRALPMVAAAMVAAALAGVSVWWLSRLAAAPVVRTTIATSGSAALALRGNDRDLAITPDGSRVVYRGDNRLLVRALDENEPTVLAGLGAPTGVFMSPDGQWVGFFDGERLLRKVRITGGPPVTIGPVDGGGSRGATWGPEGTIVYASNDPSTGLQSVSAAGGAATVLTKPNREQGEGDHQFPEFLPGGQAVLFTITAGIGGIDNAQIAVLDLRTATWKVLIQGGARAHYVPTGHLVYAVAGTLRAVAFDLGRLEVTATAAPVLEGLVTTVTGAADIAIAANGSLIYLKGAAGGGNRQTVASIDRQGRALPLPGLPPDSYRDVRVSPDGLRLALTRQDDIWTYDLARHTLSRLTTDPARDASPLWTPDGKRIIYTSSRAGYREVYWRPADGTGKDELLFTRGKDLLELRGDGWSTDGQQLLFTEVSSGQCMVGQLAIERPSDVKMLLTGGRCDENPAVSPNGRWIAYSSFLSERVEIYVEQYPDLGNRQQISGDGGRLPIWSRDGSELFFRSLDSQQMFAVRVQAGATLVAGRPKLLFEFAMLASVGSARPYDVAPNGRFVVVQSGGPNADGGPSSTLVLVQNWFEELKRLVPVN